MQGQLSLYELNRLISNAISNQLHGFYWVIAEINNINESRQGHCYLELVEKDEATDNIKASIKATIWANKFRFIKPYFEHTTGKSLEASMKVLLKVSIEFHTIYGLSLIVSDIDANYTLGDIQRKRLEIINLLISQGVINMNKSLQLPVVIQNIAVISSSGAAGYGDFINQLTSNPHSYKYSIKLYNAIMQGAQTEKSIIEALNHIYYEKTHPDVIVIIRGGGAKTDLYAFDSYDIAFHITQIPIPIFTGIGHERDDSIADMVAHTRFKTPTAVAAYINEHNKNFENQIIDIYQSITSYTKNQIKDNFTAINYLAFNIINNTKERISETTQDNEKKLSVLNKLTHNVISYQSYKLQKLTQILKTNASIASSQAKANLNIILNEFLSKPNKLINTQVKHINLIEKNIEMANPTSILKRGFSISRYNGKSVKSIKDIELEKIIETELSDGIIQSKVKTIANKKLKK